MVINNSLKINMRINVLFKNKHKTGKSLRKRQNSVNCWTASN